MVIILSLLTVGRNGDYRSELSIWEDTVAKRENNWRGYVGRGNAYMSIGENDRAIRDFDQAIKLESKYAGAYVNMVFALLKQKRFRDVLRYSDQAMRHGCDDPGLLNLLSRILATHPEPRVRDGAQAVHLAEKACERTGYKVAGILDTLAAAYAEAGQFAKAVETAERAIQLAQAAQQEKLAKDIRNRLKLYEAKQAYREPLSP